MGTHTCASGPVLDVRSAQKSVGTVSAQGKRVWVLMRRRNPLLRCSMALVVRTAFHRDECTSMKQNKPLTRFLEAVGDARALASPFVQEGFAPLLHVGSTRGIDHVPVVRVQLVLQQLRSMGQKIGALVKSTALDRQTLTSDGGDGGLQTRRTIDGRQCGLRQATGIQLLKELSPCRRALPCHGLNRQEDLLSVSSHAQGHQRRDGGGFLVQPCLDHPAVQQQMDDVFLSQAVVAPRLPVRLHLAPCAAHPVFVDGSFEEGEQHLPHPSCMGAGQVSQRDQLSTSWCGVHRLPLPGSAVHRAAVKVSSGLWSFLLPSVILNATMWTLWWMNGSSRRGIRLTNRP